MIDATLSEQLRRVEGCLRLYADSDAGAAQFLAGFAAKPGMRDRHSPAEQTLALMPSLIERVGALEAAMIDSPTDAELADIEFAVKTCMRPTAHETRMLVAAVRALRAENAQMREALIKGLGIDHNTLNATLLRFRKD